VKLKSPQEIGQALESLAGHSAMIWSYRATHSLLHFLIFVPSGRRHHLYMEAHDLEASPRERGPMELRVDTERTDGSVLVYSTDGSLRVTGARLLLTDERPERRPAYWVAMQAIHEVTAIVSASRHPHVVAQGLETIRQVSSWLGASEMPEAEFRGLFEQLAAQEPAFEPAAALVRQSFLYDIG